MPSVVTKKMTEFMGKRLEEDEELSATELHRLITRKFGKKVSAQTIRRFLCQKLHWVVVRTKTGPMISDRNKIKRMEFAKQCIAAKDSFDDVIWTDESSVQLVRHKRCQSESRQGAAVQASGKACSESTHVGWNV